MNPPAPSSKWSDERLDDLANALWAMRDVPQRVAVHETELQALRDKHALELQTVLEDLAECKAGIERLHQARSVERTERDKQRVEDQRERKRMTIQIVTVTIAAASMVVAAVALFVG